MGFGSTLPKQPRGQEAKLLPNGGGALPAWSKILGCVAKPASQAAMAAARGYRLATQDDRGSGVRRPRATERQGAARMGPASLNLRRMHMRAQQNGNGP